MKSHGELGLSAWHAPRQLWNLGESAVSSPVRINGGAGIALSVPPPTGLTERLEACGPQRGTGHGRAGGDSDRKLCSAQQCKHICGKEASMAS